MACASPFSSADTASTTGWRYEGPVTSEPVADSFAEIDVSGWAAEGVEPLGTKPKLWLVDTTGQMWVFKSTTSNRRADGSRYSKGDDWAERVVIEVAARLGLPAASTELAVRRDGDESVRFGVISKKVLSDDETLIHGNELLAEIGVSGSSPKDRSGYTLDAVRRSLEGVAPPIAGQEFTAWEWFVGYLVLDALVANTDRHQENWAVIELPGRRLAPTFDHGSSLGFQLDDSDRADRLTTTDAARAVPAFARRARSRFEGKPHPITIAHQALGMVRPDVGSHWLDRCNQIRSLQPVVDLVPDHRVTRTAKQFGVALFDANRTRTLSYAPSTVGA